ncbi:hypothetical protein HO133_003158 [Letharia lupina]|uniref:Uncharacterized protein n=1 Tax=Letharia lupina TaxID=560253 RepID=A0A8H6CBW8_9LECA|nr:uncharacterized protein HO133_003158 [Letharia lupina]KAF6220725.1 hypothetical protein HO133_003158 [Letharia lupina]
MPGSCLAAASLTKALNLSFSSQDTKSLKDAKEDCRLGDNCTEKGARQSIKDDTREEEERLNPRLQKQRGVLQRTTDKTWGIGRSTSGLAKVDIIPRDVLTGQNTGGMEGAERTNEGESSSYGRQLTGLGKKKQEIFFWTDRGWGRLLRKPAMVSQTLLEGEALEKMKKEYAVEDN